MTLEILMADIRTDINMVIGGQNLGNPTGMSDSARTVAAYTGLAYRKEIPGEGKRTGAYKSFIDNQTHKRQDLVVSSNGKLL